MKSGTSKVIKNLHKSRNLQAKVSYLYGHNPRLHMDEVLVAISMLSLFDENCRNSLTCLPQLNGCQVHTTVMLSEVNKKIFKKLGVGLTTDPVKKKTTY